MKDWIKEILLGIFGIILGLILLGIWVNKVIIVLEGVIPLLALFLGAIFIWIGIEDKKLEKELEKLEKELEASEEEKEGKKESKSKHEK